MKKLVLGLLTAFSMNVRSQITLEHTYDSAATYNFCMGNASQLELIKFEVSGERYVRVNNCGTTKRSIKIYDLNHNVLKTISTVALPDAGVPGNTMGSFLYLSEKLFNTDSKMEYMYVMTSPTFSTNIYNEDGVLLFSEPGAPLVAVNVHQVQYPVYNTAQGTKLILSYPNGQAKVFSLGGVLTTAIEQHNNTTLNNTSELMAAAAPNPASTQTNINYVLPDGSRNGEIVLYDLQGRELKRYAVDQSSNTLSLPLNDLAAGTYLYELQTGSQKSEAKKMVVVK